MKLRKPNVHRASTNPKIAAAADKRRVVRGACIKGIIMPGRLVTIQPTSFDRLEIDKRYQRDRMDDRVGMFASVLRSGGVIPDPVSLLNYLWDEPGYPKGKLWIVDGQQRSMAFLETGQPFQAMVYDCESLEAAKEFFLALQDSNPVASNRQVFVSSSRIAQMVREANEQEGHPLEGRIALGGSTRHRLAAATLAKACCIVATGKAGYSKGVRGVQSFLGRGDTELETNPRARGRVSAFLEMMGLCYEDSVKSIWVDVLAGLAYDRWFKELHPKAPSKLICQRIGRLNLDGIPLGTKFKPVILAEYSKAWPEGRE